MYLFIKFNNMKTQFRERIEVIKSIYLRLPTYPSPGCCRHGGQVRPHLTEDPRLHTVLGNFRAYYNNHYLKCLELGHVT